jgi:Flp pilus assembly pilin Flp
MKIRALGFRGQSLMEYALTVGLVAITCLATLGTLGNSIQASLLSMNTFFSSGSAPQTTALPAPGGNGSPSLPELAQAFPAAPDGAQTVCFDGTCVHLPVIDPANQHVDTAGGNGVEHFFAFVNVLQQMAEQLEASGADDGLVQRISALAKEGHNLGDDYKKTVCPFGFGAADTSPCAGLQTKYAYDSFNEKYLPQKQEFIDSYQELQHYLSKHPTVLGEVSQKVIDAQVIQIKELADGAFIDGRSNSRIQVSDYKHKDVQLIHQSANTICDQGGENCYVPI